MVCSDGIVLGADTRMSLDTFIASEEAVKIFKIDESLGVAMSGLGVDANYLVKVLKLENENHKMEEGIPMSPSAAASVLSLILQENRYTPYLIEAIVAGINKGVPELYTMDAVGGSIKESKFTANGSGAIVALGYLESAYKEGMTVDEGVKHTAKALQIAMARDAATGGSIKIVAITKKGFKEYTKEELDKLAK